MQTHRILPFAKWLTARFFKALFAIPNAIHNSILRDVRDVPGLAFLAALMASAIFGVLGFIPAMIVNNFWWMIVPASLGVLYGMCILVFVQYEKFCEEKSEFWKKLKE
jgi:hypothetical protein